LFWSNYQIHVCDFILLVFGLCKALSKLNLCKKKLQMQEQLLRSEDHFSSWSELKEELVLSNCIAGIAKEQLNKSSVMQEQLV